MPPKPSADFGKWRRTEVVRYHNRRKTVTNLDAEIMNDLSEIEGTDHDVQAAPAVQD
jgi:hypothetical protein